MTNNNLTSLKKKIAALLAMTKENGASEQEALKAMSVAQKLMEEHGVTLEDLRNVKFSDFIHESVNEGRKALHEVDNYVVPTIANYCGVKAYVDRNEGAVMKYFGYPVDVELLKYIRSSCRFAMEYEWTLYHGSYFGNVHGRKLRKSFMTGMANRLNKRLNELAFEKACNTTGTALISLKNQVVTQAFNESQGIKLRSKKAAPIKNVNWDAYNSGAAAGDRVSLNRKVYDTDTGVKLLA